MADRNRPSVRGIIRGVPLHRPRGGPPPSSGLAAQDNKPKREAILDLAKYVNEPIRVKFMGGREVVGTLKGYDQLLNLVLDDVQEQIQEPEPRTRSLGLVVLRGPLITIVSPVDGSEEIANPFLAQE
ncbi:hypothetical protein Agabi119p4_11571 [Agaricus bisporus var. burnettii]|uniref:Sm domain-containing protein n=1 Tax=Agaricus bisporus var. burnettii TaxID=192524 RepID=A0A8H7C0K6_AGABI|nr:hypothetical protein Agabi119p4_11571 [Agaricus bisporus var. burnettii]